MGGAFSCEISARRLIPATPDHMDRMANLVLMQSADTVCTARDAQGRIEYNKYQTMVTTVPIVDYGIPCLRVLVFQNHMMVNGVLT